MARTSSLWMGPRSSIGRPSTSMMRPRVPSPTGTEMGAPELATSMPRRRPSDEPMAMVLQFPRDTIPTIYDALKLVDTSSAFAEAGLTFEVQKQLGDGVDQNIENGRGSCREQVGQYVEL